MNEDKEKKEDNELENEEIIEVDDLSDEGDFFSEDGQSFDVEDQKDGEADYETVGEEEVEDLINVSRENQDEALVQELTESAEFPTDNPHHSDEPIDTPDNAPDDMLDDMPDSTDSIGLNEEEIDFINAEAEKVASAMQPANLDEEVDEKNQAEKPKKPKKSGRKKKSPSTKPTKSAKSSSAQKKERVAYILSAKKIVKDEKMAALMAYLDELLCHLPKKRIENFARSEYFSTYAEIMEKIQKSPE